MTHFQLVEPQWTETVTPELLNLWQEVKMLAPVLPGTRVAEEMIPYLERAAGLKPGFIKAYKLALIESEGSFVPSKNEIMISYKAAEDPQLILESLAHEMVHAKQAQDGRLTENGDNIIFEGVEYPKSISEVKYIKENYEEYLNHPWEHEAHRVAPFICMRAILDHMGIII